MENQVSLALAGGVQVLNPSPVDPRMRVSKLDDIKNDPTYYVGFSPIYDILTDASYSVSGGNHTTVWIFTKIGVGAVVGDKNFLYETSSSSAVWIIKHDLNKKPSVLVHDSAGTEVVGSVVYTDLNNLTITFSAPFSGEAVLN